MATVTEDTNTQSLEEGDNTPFEWGGTAYHATRIKVPPSLRPHLGGVYLGILGAMVIVCLHSHKLNGDDECIPPDQIQSRAEEDDDLRSKITGRVLVLVYLHPQALREIRAIEIANELDVPIFVAYNECDRDSLREFIELPNVRGRVALVQTPSKDLAVIMSTLNETLRQLGQEIRQKRVGVADVSVPSSG